MISSSYTITGSLPADSEASWSGNIIHISDSIIVIEDTGDSVTLTDAAVQIIQSLQKTEMVRPYLFIKDTYGDFYKFNHTGATLPVSQFVLDWLKATIVSINCDDYLDTVFATERSVGASRG